ncbi:aspartyl-tRNA synthetase [Ruminococcus sp. YE71]|uniref:aspartate--tRNA ligase n=1 Tax=unclassified Ruminococcus TaxID=2608920 RepID=UPI00088C71D8|nr:MULTISPECIES: aspartate--tRNA ligase [unclassified Ruminococcus]SDA12274.1 aspartyl-tRNA synthetase [Ruminococcus sp. YE78]SFW16677.1 aspartyl-tRNA synthetase [Ruminococcus sp. YE71]
MEMKLDTMKGLKRTHYCAEVPLDGGEVVVCGFADRVRDVGNIIFINLRDRTGLVQLAFNDETDREVFAKAQQVKSEYVLMAKGVIRDRDQANPNMKTGKVEVAVTDLRILSKAQTTPFEVTNSDKVNDELKLRYRYLDLRNPKLTKNLIMRHEIAKAAREYFYSNGFLEIETPMMMRSTPEGARDYLVPSRVHKGSFYALPQSPQIYKQLLMVSGYDRYVQIARCFRDEDLRADRQPEFTQIDLEMSFVDVDDLIATGEGFLAHVVKTVLGKEVTLPLPRLTFADSMNRYGSDKPDTRFGMEIQDITKAVEGIEFPVFTGAVEAGGSVRAIVAEGGAATYTRKEIDKLTEHAKGIGAKGLAYIRWTSEGANCSFKKFLKDGDLEKITNALGAKEGDLVLIAADKDKVVLPVLGALRLIVAKRLDIIPADKLNFLVITEMPFFEYDDESGKWLAMHHPFTMPMEECLKDLDSDPASVRAQAFDFVLNGTELSSGSMRITDFELQQKMFEALGLTDEEIAAKFGFLVDAYRYASPPHGGMGFGLDRLAMMLCGADSLRDVVAFPKVQNASELMSACPSVVDSEQLDELGIAIKE